MSTTTSENNDSAFIPGAARPERPGETLHIIFYCPRIPENTGATIRLSACTGAHLHLVEPMVFEMTNKRVKRAGLDYHDLAHVSIHPNLDAALEWVPGRVWAFTGHCNNSFADVRYELGDGLLFGPEDTGLPEEVMLHPRVTRRVRIPMVEGVRSLNLASSAAIAIYRAWGELGFPNGI